MTLFDYGFKGHPVWVQIVDYFKLINSDRWVKIGEAHCDDPKNWRPS